MPAAYVQRIDAHHASQELLAQAPEEDSVQQRQQKLDEKYGKNSFSALVCGGLQSFEIIFLLEYAMSQNLSSIYLPYALSPCYLCFVSKIINTGHSLNLFSVCLSQFSYFLLPLPPSLSLSLSLSL